MRKLDWYEITGLVAVIIGMATMGWIYSITRELSWQICLVIVTGLILVSGIMFKDRLKGYFDPDSELLKIPEKRTG